MNQQEIDAEIAELRAIGLAAQTRREINAGPRVTLLACMLSVPCAVDVVAPIVESTDFDVPEERAIFDELIAKAEWISTPSARIEPVALGVAERGFPRNYLDALVEARPDLVLEQIKEVALLVAAERES